MSRVEWIVLLVALMVSLVCYLVARIRMSKEKLVLTAGRLDVTFVMISPLFAILGWMIQKMVPSATVLIWVLWTIAIICFSLSIMYSIIENKESPWDMVWSIGAKIFIFITTIFIILFSMVAFLGYSVFFLIRQLSKSDEEAEHDSKGKFALPQYRKFMNAYVGVKKGKA